MTDTKTYETTKLDIEDKQSKAADLLKYTVEVLEGATLAQLRELAKGLIKNIKSKENSKERLLAKLLVIRDSAQKVVDNKALEIYQSEEVKKERWATRELSSTKEKANAMIDTLKSRITSATNDLERLEIIVMYATATLDGLRKEGYAKTTIKGMLTEIGGVINDYQTDSDLLKMSLDTFIKTLWSQFSKDKEEINYNDKIRVAKNLTEEKRVNGTALLEKAKKFLESIPTDVVFDKNSRNNPVKWSSVVASLVLVTGRRPAEILSSAVFEKGASANELRFKGQLKAKGEFRDARMGEFNVIPCLVDDYLAINALNYLKSKRLDDPNFVNDTYAKELSREMKQWVETAGLAIPVYALRKVYASLCQRFFYTGKERGAVIYIASIMGHQPNDYTTVQTYREFEVD